MGIQLKATLFLGNVEVDSFTSSSDTLIGNLTDVMGFAPLPALEAAKRESEESDELEGVTQWETNLDETIVWVDPDMFAVRGDDAQALTRIVTEPA